MSKKFLTNLNGNKNGAFNKWLNAFKGEPRIAWYPSAGEDFRDLLFLHPDYPKTNPDSVLDPQPPDIFLHTDYFPWSKTSFLDSPNIYRDDHTSITMEIIEELPSCDLPLDKGIVYSQNGSNKTGRVLFLKVEVVSDLLGKFSAPVIYAFVENSVFCAKRILPQDAVFSHVIHVRYGGGMGGGGHASGVWLLNILKRVRCECFITDGHHNRQTGDERTYDLFPVLAGAEDTTQLDRIRIVPSSHWSGHGDVSWNMVKQA